MFGTRAHNYPPLKPHRLHYKPSLLVSGHSASSAQVGATFFTTRPTVLRPSPDGVRPGVTGSNRCASAHIEITDDHVVFYPLTICAAQAHYFEQQWRLPRGGEVPFVTPPGRFSHQFTHRPKRPRNASPPDACALASRRNAKYIVSTSQTLPRDAPSSVWRCMNVGRGIWRCRIFVFLRTRR